MNRPSPALIVACIALFVALGGTSYAVAQLPADSVGSKQIRKSAVTSTKIKDGTILVDDLASATRTALRGATGATGPAGPAGATGDPGTASGFAAKTSTDALPTTWQTVLSLSGSLRRSGTITVAKRSRLAISASVTGFGRGDMTSPGAFACRPKVTANGQYVALEAVDVNAWAQLPAADSTFASVPVVGSALVDAGTYDVGVECSALGASVIVTVDAYLVVQAAVA